MKRPFFSLSAIAILAISNAFAQVPVVTQFFGSPDRIVKGAPFSAEAISESVQILQDGNRITRRITEKLYRSSDGKFRRESNGMVPGIAGFWFGYGSDITILKPDLGEGFFINSKDRTYRVMMLSTNLPTLLLPKYRGKANGDETSSKAIIAGKADLTAGKPRDAQPPQTISSATTSVTLSVTTSDKQQPPPPPPFPPGDKAPMLPDNNVLTVTNAYTISAFEGQKTDLGKRQFDGVEATGTLVTTIIPAGAIGNERPIEITYERWFSPQLGMVVYSRQFDPRFGENIYRLTGIVLSEPDPSLFEIPADYKLLNPQPKSGNDGGTVEYRRMVKKP